MEDAGRTREHRLLLVNRKNCSLSGVREVESFDMELVVLATDQGRITIKGRDMHMISLNVEKGELDFAGEVDNIAYSQINSPKTVTTGLLKRLFR
jgi:sporulation protein YabP